MTKIEFRGSFLISSKLITEEATFLSWLEKKKKKQIFDQKLTTGFFALLKVASFPIFCKFGEKL